MDTISYLQNVYGYDVPIFLKDIRIGGKSKTAIKQELYRGEKKGLINKYSQGVYYFDSKKEFGSGITFESVITKKYIKDTDYELSDLDIYGYYSGITFLNIIGVSTQVPAIVEITTNNASSNKREVNINGFRVIIRKPKIKIDFTNWKTLQFLDMFYYLTDEEIKDNKKILIDYMKNNLQKIFFVKTMKFYDSKTLKKIISGGLLDAFTK